jgi:hypothetical protein
MDKFSPLGIGWVDWYAERIFNFSEFLKLNGFFSFNGFSIWTDCSDCNLSSQEWIDGIYLSHHSVSFLPYVLLNYFFDKEILLIFGPIINLTMIFISGLLLAELARQIIEKHSLLPLYVVSILCFSFFAMNPWTYKMILQPWTEVYFLIFILWGMFVLSKGYNKLGLVFFFCAGLSHYQWSVLIGSFYLVLLILNMNRDNSRLLINYFPGNLSEPRQATNIFLAFMISSSAIILIRMLTEVNLDQTSGSSLLYRIGLSGNDMHNGGLLGALQFLGGNRVTTCLNGMESGALIESQNIFLYNCIMSTSSMVIISIISIFGIIKLLSVASLSRPVVLPLLFAMVAMICILQQSLSVHLMGYSYIFSALFGLGMISIFALSFNSISSKAMRLIFIAPISLGVLITCIRVSMLTGING